jgi:hypothetical protein
MILAGMVRIILYVMTVSSSDFVPLNDMISEYKIAKDVKGNRCGPMGHNPPFVWRDRGKPQETIYRVDGLQAKKEC